MTSVLRATAPVLAVMLAVPAAGLVTASPAAAATVGTCYGYLASTVGQVSSPAPAVECAQPHTAETYLVSVLGERFGLPSKASTAKRLTAAQACTVAAMNTYLGMPSRTLPSRFRVVALFPTDDQWRAGDRSMRCDAVLERGRQLQPVTGPASAFVARSTQQSLDLCTPDTPKPNGTTGVECSTPKRNWIKVLEQRIGGPRTRYPGLRKVLRRGSSICETAAKRWDGGARYPGWWWINPTQAGWRAGKRSVQCYVPYQQYLKEIAKRPVPSPTVTPAPTPSPSASPTS